MRLCFSNVTAFENGERVMIKAEWQSKWWRSRFRSDSVMSNSNGFLSFFWGGGLCVCFLFFVILQETPGSFCAVGTVVLLFLLLLCVSFSCLCVRNLFF